MACGLKYELLATSKKFADLWKLRLSFADYVGAEIDRNVPLSPFRPRKDSAGTIRGTTLEFGIRATTDFEFLEFYTEDTRKILAELYKGSTLMWTGYVLPEQYQESYRPAPVTVWFTAADGLGTLKDIDYTQVGRKSQLEIILYCLNKLDLSLPVVVANTVHEDSHSTSYCAFYQTYEDAEIYHGKSCYDTLWNILEKYDASITQSRGRWLIMRSADIKATRYLYDSAGAYTGTEAAPAVLDLGEMGDATADVIALDGSPNLDIEKGGHEVTISHDYGRKDSLLPSSNAENFTAGSLTGWIQSGDFTLEQGEDSSGKYIKIPTYSLADEYLATSIAVTAPSDEQFMLRLKYAAIGIDVSRSPAIDTVSMTVRMIISYTSGASTWYLDETDGWVSSVNTISKTINSCKGAPEWNTLEVVTDSLPASSGTITVLLYRYKAFSIPPSYIRYIGVCFTSIQALFLQDGQFYPAGIGLVKPISSTATGKLDDIEVIAADAPDVDNASLLYGNITRLSDGSLTDTWGIDGKTGTDTFLNILARTIASRARKPRQRLMGTFRGQDITYDSVIRHTYNSSREFEILEMEHDVYEDKFRLTLLEILPWEEVTIITGPDIEVTAIAIGDTTLTAEDPIDCTVTVVNTGADMGSAQIEFQIYEDGSSPVNVVGGGRHPTGNVPKGGSIDVVIGDIYAPSTADTYRVRARILSSGDDWIYSPVITVTAAPYTTVDPSSISPTFAGGSFTFDIDSNVPWTAAERSAYSWMEIGTTSGGSGITTVTVTVAANTGSARSGYIDVVSEVGTVSVQISQAACLAPVVGLTPGEGELWTMSSPSASGTRGSSTLNFSFTPSGLSATRITVIVLVSGSQTANSTVSARDWYVTNGSITLPSAVGCNESYVIEIYETLPK